MGCDTLYNFKNEKKKIHQLHRLNEASFSRKNILVCYLITITKNITRSFENNCDFKKFESVIVRLILAM